MKQKTNLKFKKIFLFSLILIFSLALALNTNALTLTLQTTTWNLNTKVNVSLDISGSEIIGENITNVAIFASSSSTANSSTSRVINLTNASDQNFMVMASANFTFGSNIVLEDSNNYAITAKVTGNGGVDGKALSATTATIDRTAPSIPTSISPAGRNITTNDHTFRATVNGANTTSCTLTFTDKNPGQNAYAMTHSGNSCTQSINDIAEGIYKYTITASDGTNSSAPTSEQELTIDLPSSASRKAKLFNALGGGGTSKENIGRGLEIAQKTRAGEVSQGLAKAQARINEIVQKETQPKELTKTAIGAGTGIVVGVVVGTIVLPGIGTVAAPIALGLLGTGIGIAV